MEERETFDGRADELLELLARERRDTLSLAELRAAIGERFLGAKAQCRERQESWEQWLAGLRVRAQSLGLPPLIDTAVRAYMRMALFRRRHPELAAAYLQLDPTGLCSVLTLPSEVLEEFAREGVPTRDGLRTPLAQATTRQLAYAGRVARARLRGEAAREAKEERPPEPGEDPFEQAMALLAKCGTLTVERFERVVGLVTGMVEAEPEHPTARAVLVTAALEGSGGDRRALAGRVVETLEQLVPIAEALMESAGPEERRRAAVALARLMAVIARWREVRAAG